MVEINFGRARPPDVVAIDRLDELKSLQRNGRVRMGALVTYTRMLDEDPGSLALREAARTVGSPQIRNAGTIGGNLGTCSPAGDTLPVLAALDATGSASARAARRSLGRPTPSASLPGCSTRRAGSGRHGRARLPEPNSVVSSPPPRGRSTTSAVPRHIDARCSR